MATLMGNEEYRALLHRYNELVWRHHSARSDTPSQELNEINARLEAFEFEFVAAELAALRVPSVFEVVASDYDETMLRWAGAGCEVFEP